MTTRAAPAGRTTTVYLRQQERRLVELAARLRECGPSRYLRLAAIETARRDLGHPEPSQANEGTR